MTTTVGTQTGRAQVWRDTNNDIQLRAKRVKGGRKVSDYERMQKLIEASSVHLLFRFSAVNSLSTGAPAIQGYHWLLNEQVQALQEFTLPVFIFPLFNVNQGYIPPTNNKFCGLGGYKLRMFGTQLRWVAENGVLTDNNVNKRIEIIQNGEYNVQYYSVGRKSLVDWTKAKFTFWGKTNEPSMIRVSLVKFEDDEFCPEQGMSRTDASPERALSDAEHEFWVSRLKPLCSNPASVFTRLRGSPKDMVILEEKIIEINPNESIDDDVRPAMRALEMFNRWNRVIDYTEPPTNVFSHAGILNPNAGINIYSGFTGYPRRPTHNCYILVESFQPTLTNNDPIGEAVATTTANTASFDVSIEYSHTSLDTTHSVFNPA